ncbi:hypothetical protein ACRRTK_018610 [Alexandromys fortis]
MSEGAKESAFLVLMGPPSPWKGAQLLAASGTPRSSHARGPESAGQVALLTSLTGSSAPQPWETQKRGARGPDSPRAARVAARCRAKPHRARSHWPQVAALRPTGSPSCVLIIGPRPCGPRGLAQVVAPRSSHWPQVPPAPVDWPSGRPGSAPAQRRPPPRPARRPSSAELARPAPSVPRCVLPSAFRRPPRLATRPCVGGR